MKNLFLKFVPALATMLFVFNVHALTLLGDAMETESLRISLNDDNTGFVQGRICDECPLLKVAITPETKAYDGKVEVPLKKAAGRIGRYATVHINLEHTKVIRINW